MDDKILRKLQQVQTEMMIDIVNVCEKNNIKYYLGFGTMLGAVRHQGFIPWDDDIDLIMPYSDYKRFVKVAQNELGDQYFVQNTNTDPNWYRAYTTVRKNNTTMMYSHWSKFNVHQGIWLDIFPIAEMGSNFEIKIKKNLLRISNYLLMDNYIAANQEEFKKVLGKVGYSSLQLIYKLRRKQRIRIHNFLVDYICSGSGKKYYAEIWNSITDIHPHRCFEGDDSFVTFAGRQYRAMHDYGTYLSSTYGPNYMTPIKEEKGHDGLIIDFENNWTKYYEE